MKIMLLMKHYGGETDNKEIHLISNFAVHPVAAIDTHLNKSSIRKWSKANSAQLKNWKNWLNLVVFMINRCPLVKVLEMGSLKQSNSEYMYTRKLFLDIWHFQICIWREVNLHFPGLH